MATSGSISYGSTVKVTLTWNRQSYSVQSNTSTLYWELILNSSIPIILSGQEPYSVTFDNQSFTGTTKINTGINQNKVLATGTVEIQHNSDGTKEFLYGFKQRLDAYGTLYGDAAQGGTAVLDVIPRPAVLSVATNFTEYDNPQIAYKSPSGKLTGTLEACISLTGGEDDVPYRTLPITGETDTGWYTFSLTEEERNTLRRAITSGTSIKVRFYIRNTIDGVRYWSYLTRTFSIVDYMPSMTPTVVDTNPKTIALTGSKNKLVRYHSNALLTFGAAAPKGISLVKKTVSNGSKDIVIEDPNQDTVTINNVDSNTFYLSATDSRGNTERDFVVFNESKGDYIPYFNVTCNQTIHLSLEQVITLTVKGKYFNGSFGAQRNSLTIQTRHREYGEEWSDWGDISILISDISNDSYTLTTELSGYDPSGTYEFQCRAIDKLHTAESAIDTVTLKPVFDWGKRDFNFNVPVTIEGNPLEDYVIEYGTEAMGSNGTWYWSKWKSGKAECYGCRNYGNMGVSTAYGGLYRSAIFTQTLPGDVFVKTPDVIDISLRGGSYGGWIIRHEESAPSEYDTGSFIVVRPASATISQAYISFNIVGRWK